MFDVKSFSNILQKITDTYTSISEFAEKSEVNRTYLSKYINMKLDNPPTPKILQKLANASNGIISYYELMQICGYISDNEERKQAMTQSQSDYIELRRYILEDNDFSSSEILELKNIASIVDNSKYKEKFNSFLQTLTDSKRKIAINLIKDSMNYIKSLSYSENYKANNQYYMCPVYRTNFCRAT